jgi:hypothetical protein
MSAAIVGVAAAGALAQWYNSEEARKANREDRKRIEALINKLQSPQLQSTPLTPDEYKLLGKYTPEIANYVQEKAPEVIKETGSMKEGRDAQLAALRQLRDIARQERDPALMAQLDLAAQRSQSEAQSRQQSLLQDAARRGQSSGLGNLVAQMQGGESAMSRGAEQSRLAAIEAYRNRLGALRGSAELGGQIRGQDVDMQSRNADIINAFNQRAAAGQNAYLQNASGIRNAAQLQNLNAEQNIANMNVDTRNRFLQSNRQMANDMYQQNYLNELNKINAMTGGIQQGMQQRTGEAQDRNQMIQGLGNIYGSYQTGEDARDFEKKKAIYNKTGNENIFDD